MIIILVALVVCILSGMYLRNPKNGESIDDLESILYVEESEKPEKKKENLEVEDDKIMDDLDTSDMDEEDPLYAQACERDAYDILREVNDEK